MNYIEELWKQIPEQQAIELKKLKELSPEINLNFAVLNDHGQLIDCDLATSIIWQQLHPEGSKIAFDNFGKVEVSTVFLHFDHGFGKKLFFESMAFINKTPDSKTCIRAKTLEEAHQNHDFLCNTIRLELLRN